MVPSQSAAMKSLQFQSGLALNEIIQKFILLLRIPWTPLLFTRMITADYFSSSCFISLILRLFLLSSVLFVESSALNSATVYGGNTWINNLQSLPFLQPSSYADALIRPNILTNNISYNGMNLQFGCGFFCYGSPCDTGFLFAIFFVIYSGESEPFDMQMVWTSNRERMVKENATLRLTSTGELVLKDADGTLVWSTNTSTQDFQEMTIQESGNLVLITNSGGIMWQSFDHPTDTVLSGQKFMLGQKLIANTSPTNVSKGNFFSYLLPDSSVMATVTEPTQMYFRYPWPPTPVNFTYSQFDNEYICIYSEGGGPASVNYTVPKSSLYYRIDSNGHMIFCSVVQKSGRILTDYLTSFIMNTLPLCDYPTPCGDYGVCTNDQCSCPSSGNIFRPRDVSEPNLGCVPHIALVCSEKSRPQDYQFLEMEHVSYFAYVLENSSTRGLVSKDECKNLCLNNCSCKAAFFWYDTSYSISYCYLESNVYSVKRNGPSDVFYNSTAYIKYQSKPKQIKHLVRVIIFPAVGGVILLFLFVWVWISKYHKGRKEKDEDDNDPLDWPAGLPVRYSFEELQNATRDFSIKLGSGGFGSVYEGVQSNGSKIAVKRLERAGQGEKEFRAEVETLGNIRHLHLVRLKGFCSEKSNQMLVDWNTRFKVVLGIARGLTYLHEECSERIIHFDIKPQNILLDQDFTAKVSDFGLAKLLNRDQSEVITMLRGTPGYMAPELLNMHITEKADIFSFGVMVVEIVSGKRSREISENLFSVLRLKAEQGRLIDLVYEGRENEETGVKEEAVKLLKVGMWCAQKDFNRRPAMSVVVKVLEGLVDMLDDISWVFTESSATSNFTVHLNHNRNLSSDSTASVLSAPR